MGFAGCDETVNKTDQGGHFRIRRVALIGFLDRDSALQALLVDEPRADGGRRDGHLEERQDFSRFANSCRFLLSSRRRRLIQYGEAHFAQGADLLQG